MEIDRCAAAFKALSDPTRLRILTFLRDCSRKVAVTDEGDIAPMQGPNVGEVCCHITGVEKATSTISFHLKELRQAGVIKMTKQGKHMICEINQSALLELGGFLSEFTAPYLRTKTVLFVCVHNAGRSQMAEAFFNAKAKESGLPIRAVSAGTLGTGELNPRAIEAMTEVGISLADHQAKLLTDAMVQTADVIVSMGCGVDAESCPAKFIVTEDWGLDDPAGLPLRAVRLIRDQIELKVIDLLRRIA